MNDRIILNELELRAARARLSELLEALSSDSVLQKMIAGLPPEVVVQVTRMMRAESRELESSIAAYATAKDTGRPSALQERTGNNPGLTLIVARIAKGYSQKELAWRLGLKEQQIQRYEADRYSSISLKNYARVAALLGVNLRATITEDPAFRGLDKMIEDVSKESLRTILKHGRSQGWFAGEMDEGKLRQYVAENRIKFGSPSLLRTGLNVIDHSEDILLHAWRAQVAKRARGVLATDSVEFDPLRIEWLPDLVRLSAHTDGPLRAQEMLRRHGILLIPEPQIPGLAIDGAAFLEEGVPVIGVTARKDTLDNFWFTLLHEVGHAILHYRSGLAGGFFDQFEDQTSTDQEAEADRFASSLLIPEETWKRSTARISRSTQSIIKFANDLGIHPAIVFGRIRKERKNYSLFSKEVGSGTVRKQLIGET